VKGFILAAGYGERLMPLTRETPKCLIPVLNLPAICYSVFLLKEAGIREIMCNLHYRHREIIRFFQDNNFFGMKVSFSVEDEILGTGGGLKKCQEWIGGSDFILINSDIVLDVDLSVLINSHHRSSFPATLLLYRSEKAKHIGSVGVKSDRVVDFQNMLETGSLSDFIYTGVAVLSPVIFDYLHNEFSSIVRTGFSGLVQNQSVGYHEHKGFWHDIGTLRSYWETNILWASQVLSLRERLSGVLGMIPETISPEATIKPGARVTDSVLGRGGVIGEGAVVERSVVLPGACVKNRAVIKGAVVSQDTILDIKA